MYTPKLNRNENTQEIIEFVKQNGFGILVSTVNGKPWATHLPLLINTEGTILSGHLARGNAQWRELSHNEEVLVIFTGPHAYISSSWYDHENVPTWNYISVHIYGKIRITEGEKMLADLTELTNKYEKDSVKPVTVEGMSEKFLAAEIRGIVGIEMDIIRIESTFKLSQNRDDKNYKVITQELEKRKCPLDAKVAQEMKKIRPLD
ncbi:MAG TPA: FMN-binding negative transcriptional regulator [Cyclobacteriaceae bacterium]